MYEIIRTYQHHNNQRIGWIIVQCDTDFVARNEEFLKFVDNMIMGLVGTNAGNYAYLENFFYDTNPATEKTFGEDIIDARKKFGEDIRIRNYGIIKTGLEEQVEEESIRANGARSDLTAALSNPDIFRRR